MGLLTVVNDALPSVRTVRVHAFDGNQHALRLLEEIVAELQKHVSLAVSLHVTPLTIEDFYDLSLFDEVLARQFDIIMSFKAICEFVTKDRFEQANPYAHFAKAFLPKLNESGIMLLEDVTSYNKVSQEWLPRMMDAGLKQAGCNIVGRNEGYNETFTISHSQRMNDCSKVAWRIIKQ